ncbi:hypothetical protein TorRG33x02_091550, partial [Trema orientale]
CSLRRFENGSGASCASCATLAILVAQVLPEGVFTPFHSVLRRFVPTCIGSPQ